MLEGASRVILTLSKVQFADEQTLQKMEEVGENTQLTFVYTSEDEPQMLPDAVWAKVKQRALAKSELTSKERGWILAQFKGQKWTLDEDSAAVEQLEGQAQEAVPAVSTTVGAGTRIIEEGETATSRHMAMVAALNKEIKESVGRWQVMTWIGSVLLAALFWLGAAAYLRVYHRDVFRSNKRLFLLTIVAILTLLIAKGTEFLFVQSTLNLVEVVRFPLFVPFAAILICSLLNARVGAFMVAFLSIVLSLMLAVDQTGFLVINVLAGIVVVLSTRSLRRRKEVFIVCGKAYIGCVLIVLSFHLYDNALWELSTLWDLLSTFLFMLITGVMVVGLLPLFEAGFRMVTEITLMEYMDPTHPLLRRLSVEAPGTYQHSIVVGNLAEAAAIGIGASGLFCRAATLYHDIGKLAAPQYFTENQTGGMNIHTLLTPQESAQVIMNHVPEGVAIARKHSLPEAFIQIIKEHHGDTLVYFFYHKQVDMMGGDAALVDEQDFRYSGPKPRSKESSIIMMADTAEAASRSVDEMTEETVQQLVNRLVQEKIDDGQLERSLLTYEDLEKVKKSLAKSLLAATHTRIKYPSRTPPAGGADDPAWPPEEEDEEERS